MYRIRRARRDLAPGGPLLELDSRLAPAAPPRSIEGGTGTQRRGSALGERRRPAPRRERPAPQQAGPGRGHHRRPGKSARALGGDLEERGLRRVVDAVMDAAVDELTAAIGNRKAACVALGRSRATNY